MSTAQIPAGLTIAQLAARTGLRPDTIRYYERCGLLCQRSAESPHLRSLKLPT
jgi:hypothetical protein